MITQSTEGTGKSARGSSTIKKRSPKTDVVTPRKHKDLIEVSAKLDNITDTTFDSNTNTRDAQTKTPLNFDHKSKSANNTQQSIEGIDSISNIGNQSTVNSTVIVEDSGPPHKDNTLLKSDIPSLPQKTLPKKTVSLKAILARQQIGNNYSNTPK